MDLEEINTIQEGNQPVFQSRKAVILNSRQSKTPVGNDPWVRKTLEAVKSAIEKGYAIVSSVGMNTWELSLWATGEYGGNGVVLLPIEKNRNEKITIEKLTVDFELRPERFGFYFLESGIKTRSSKSWWDSRDETSISIADIVMPVSIRAKGRWSQFIESINPEIIDDSFRISYSQKGKGKGLEFRIPDEIPRRENWDYLTHWTRRFYEPWPGEKSSDFYRAIVSSGNEYPRTASATLQKILSDRILRGSGARIRGGTPVVAFTSLEPRDAIGLMKWRSRYVRYTFEPYGIAIRKSAAVSLGMRQVEYVSNRKNAVKEDAEFIQGYSKGDWPKEAEWRFAGDLNLNLLDPSDIKILVPQTSEAERFQTYFPYEVISLELT